MSNTALRTLGHVLYLPLAAAYAAWRGVWTCARWRARGVRLSRGAILSAHADDALDLSPGVAVGFGTLLIAASDKSRLSPSLSRLKVGAGTTINEYCNLRAAGGAIEIGRKCIIAQFVTVVASNHSTAAGKPMIDQAWEDKRHGVTIGNDVWIGANAVILPGTTIHDGAVIAAGAVVNRDVPCGEIWGGVPARKISARTP